MRAPCGPRLRSRRGPYAGPARPRPGLRANGPWLSRPVPPVTRVPAAPPAAPLRRGWAPALARFRPGLGSQDPAVSGRPLRWLRAALCRVGRPCLSSWPAGSRSVSLRVPLSGPLAAWRPGRQMPPSFLRPGGRRGGPWGRLASSAAPRRGFYDVPSKQIRRIRSGSGGAALPSLGGSRPPTPGRRVARVVFRKENGVGTQDGPLTTRAALWYGDGAGGAATRNRHPGNRITVISGEGPVYPRSCHRPHQVQILRLLHQPGDLFLSAPGWGGRTRSGRT